MHPSISRLWLAFAESDHALGRLPRDPISVFHFCDTPTDVNLCAELVRYQAAFKVLVSKVDTNERHAVPWPDWAVSARIDAGAHREGVWRAVRSMKHRSLSMERCPS